MPNIKSAMKRVKVAEKKNMRNRIVISQLRTSLKKVEAASKSEFDPKTLASQAFSAIDKAAAKGVIHKNTANRKKARMARMLKLS